MAGFMLTKQNNKLPILALLLGATCWGIAWYPYRLLNQSGFSGEAATALTYLVALISGIIFLRKNLSIQHNTASSENHWLIWIGITAGWTSIAYTLGVIHGEIVRVLLLFYLAPFWTIFFARLLLNERLSLSGYWVIVLSLSGAMTILWQSGNDFPFPTQFSDWMGLSGGIMFALNNVLIRKDQHHTIEQKSLAIWLGVFLLSFMLTGMTGTLPNLDQIGNETGLILLGLGITIFLLSILLQYGLTHVPANQAIVILLLELFIAAIAAYYLADEQLSAKEWIGGLMVVIASLLSTKIHYETSQA